MQGCALIRFLFYSCVDRRDRLSVSFMLVEAGSRGRKHERRNSIVAYCYCFGNLKCCYDDHAACHVDDDDT